MSVNLPATGWIGGDQSEYTSGSSTTIDDTAGVLLVDTAGVSVIDTDVVQTPLPATAWTEDDSV